MPKCKIYRTPTYNIVEKKRKFSDIYIYGCNNLKPKNKNSNNYVVVLAQGSYIHSCYILSADIGFFLMRSIDYSVCTYCIKEK